MYDFLLSWKILTFTQFHFGFTYVYLDCFHSVAKSTAKFLLWKDFSLIILKAALVSQGLHDISAVVAIMKWDIIDSSLHLHLWPFLLCLINKIIFLFRISGFCTFAISFSFPFYLLPLFQLSHNLGHSPDLSFGLDHWSFLSTFVQSFPSQPLELRSICVSGCLCSLFFPFSHAFRSKAPELSSTSFFPCPVFLFLILFVPSVPYEGSLHG